MGTEAVAMIGNLNMDLIIRGVPSQPVWGREVIGNGYSLVPAGQAAYTAFALCGLGVPVRLVAVRDLFRRARKEGAKTVLDTGWDPFGWPAERLGPLREVLAEVSVFLPNRDEAKAITGHDDPRAAAEALREMGVGLAVIKLGVEGSFALGDSVEVSLPALPATVLDSVGAGDVYVGGFVFGMLRQMAVRDCMALGSAAAGLYISRGHRRFPVLSDVLAAAREYGVSIEEVEV